MGIRNLIIFWALLAAGCTPSGGDSPTAPSTSTPPTISSLYLYPSSSPLNDGGGAITLYLTVDYYDPDGDIITFTATVTKKDMAGAVIGAPAVETSEFSQSLEGKTVGRVSGGIGVADTTYPHSTTFDIYFNDKAGNKSNTLTATWTVK